MKRFFLLLLLGFSAVACQKNPPSPSSQEAEDPDWIKLEIPTKFSGDEAYSVIGDIDKTMLVSTKAQVYSSSDRGKTWQESRYFAGAMYGLLQRNDTIFALSSYSTDSQGQKTATIAEHFTIDFGKTWTNVSLLPNGYYRERKLTQIFGKVEVAGVTYRTQENTEPIANSTSRLVVASDLFRTEGTTQTTVRLPARHYLKGLHVDAQQRLYVAASGLRFDTNGIAINPTVGRPAVLYVSRRPRP